MGEFIRIIINQNKCSDIERAQELIAVCPVNIFVEKEGQPAVNAENEDECILCEQCLQTCPEGAITIHKLYEQA